MPSYDYKIETINHLTQTHIQIITHPLAGTMHFGAGQYLMVKYPDGNFMPFSIANAPMPEHNIELHIRTSPADLPTQEFLKSIEQEKSILIQGPFGDCQYQEQPGPLLLLAAGTGLAPAKAIIEQLIKDNKTKQCHLYWTVKQPTDFYLPELPVLWCKLLDNFHYTPICTQSGRSNNIIDAVVTDFSDLSNAQIYVFGPTSLALDALKKFLSHKLNVTHFFTDVLSKEQVLEWRQIT